MLSVRKPEKGLVGKQTIYQTVDPTPLEHGLRSGNLNKIKDHWPKNPLRLESDGARYLMLAMFGGLEGTEYVLQQGISPNQKFGGDPFYIYFVALFQEHIHPGLLDLLRRYGCQEPTPGEVFALSLDDPG